MDLCYKGLKATLEGHISPYDNKKQARQNIYLVFLPAAKPSRSRSGESSSPGEKSRIEYLGDLIPTVSMLIGPTKFFGDLKLDPRRCSGPSRGATSVTSLWWKAVEGRNANHRGNLG